MYISVSNMASFITGFYIYLAFVNDEIHKAILIDFFFFYVVLSVSVFAGT